MSEEAKLAYLQEKIRETKGHRRNGLIELFVGLILSVIGFGGIRFFGSNAGILIGIGGIIVAVLGGSEGFYNAYRYEKLMEQFKALATVMPTCPKCGKQIPQGNYVFCPFCGTSLKS